MFPRMSQEPSTQKSQICPTCGTRLSETATRCLVCGTELTAKAATNNRAGITNRICFIICDLILVARSKPAFHPASLRESSDVDVLPSHHIVSVRIYVPLHRLPHGRIRPIPSLIFADTPLLSEWSQAHDSRLEPGIFPAATRNGLMATGPDKRDR